MEDSLFIISHSLVLVNTFLKFSFKIFLDFGSFCECLIIISRTFRFVNSFLKLFSNFLTFFCLSASAWLLYHPIRCLSTDFGNKKYANCGDFYLLLLLFLHNRHRLTPCFIMQAPHSCHKYMLPKYCYGHRQGDIQDNCRHNQSQAYKRNNTLL